MISVFWNGMTAICAMNIGFAQKLNVQQEWKIFEQFWYLIFDKLCPKVCVQMKYIKWYSLPTVDSTSCQVKYKLLKLILKHVLGGIVFCAEIEDQTYIINVNGYYLSTYWNMFSHYHYQRKSLPVYCLKLHVVVCHCCATKNPPDL